LKLKRTIRKKCFICNICLNNGVFLMIISSLGLLSLSCHMTSISINHAMYHWKTMNISQHDLVLIRRLHLVWKATDCKTFTLFINLPCLAVKESVIVSHVHRYSFHKQCSHSEQLYLCTR
jgi:hypothetical protein